MNFLSIKSKKQKIKIFYFLEKRDKRLENKRIVGSVGRVRRVRSVQGSNRFISLHICHKKYSVWALALKAIRL